MIQKFVMGTGCRVITPPLGTLLYGYPYVRPASAVHDDLRATVLAFGYEQPTDLLISLDVCTVSTQLSDRIKQLITEQTGIAANHINIAAVHTHSGPCLTTSVGWGSANDTYIEDTLIPEILRAVLEAVSETFPVLMGIGTTESNVGINRRQMTRESHIILGQCPYGLRDTTMTILAFATPDGKPIANIVHYGAHPTSAGHALEITRDWPGYMVDRMESETNALTLFINGSEGDVGPRLSNGKTIGNLSYTREVGSLAAMDAVRAYQSIKEYREVSFRMITDTISIPHKPLPKLEDALSQLEQLGVPGNLKSIALKKYDSLSKRIQLLKKGEALPTHFTFSQTLFAFGSAVLVPFPYEIFSEISLRIRNCSPFEHTLCIINANGANAYLPSQDQLCRGGYEIDQFLYHSVNPLVENADDFLVSEALRIIEQL